MGKVPGLKAQRHQKILELINERVISTQYELAAALREEGFDITQGTVSRDVKVLGLVKVTREGKVRYAAPEPQPVPGGVARLARLFRDAVTAVDTSENLVVVKTLPGAAQQVASAIDHANWTEIVGTVGGDDTILVVARSKEAAPHLAERFLRLLKG